MKLSRGSIGWLAALVVLAVALGTGAFAPSTTSAAPPSIDTSSCGLADGAPAVPNTYCSFQTTGEDVVIGPDSCNTPNSCEALADGVKINPFGLSWTTGSCNGDGACNFSGQNGGMVEVLGGSCNGVEACFAAAQTNGMFQVGNGSCNGFEACYAGAQTGGSLGVGNGSCNGERACFAAAQSGGSFDADHGSCNAVEACWFGGVTNGNFDAGHGSCNGPEACQFGGNTSGNFEAGYDACNAANACEFAGNSAGGSFKPGHGSCNAESACRHAGGQSGSFGSGSMSCNGPGACQFVGAVEEAEVGHHSCNVELACSRAGDPTFGPPAIGSFSCNQSGAFIDECTNNTGSPQPPVGDCMYNDPSPPGVIVHRTLGCALVGTPDLSPFGAIWQAILGAFTFN